MLFTDDLLAEPCPVIPLSSGAMFSPYCRVCTDEWGRPDEDGGVSEEHLT